MNFFVVLRYWLVVVIPAVLLFSTLLGFFVRTSYKNCLRIGSWLPELKNWRCFDFVELPVRGIASISQKWNRVCDCDSLNNYRINLVSVTSFWLKDERSCVHRLTRVSSCWKADSFNWIETFRRNVHWRNYLFFLSYWDTTFSALGSLSEFRNSCSCYWPWWSICPVKFRISHCCSVELCHVFFWCVKEFFIVRMTMFVVFRFLNVEIRNPA